MKQNIDVAAGIWKKERKLFLACRKGGFLDGLWEFPGGKREPGESFSEALMREWKEELECFPDSPELLAETLTDINSGIRVRMQTFIFSSVTGEPVLHDHSEAGWFSGEEIRMLELAPADIDLLPILFSAELDMSDLN